MKCEKKAVISVVSGSQSLQGKSFSVGSDLTVLAKVPSEEQAICFEQMPTLHCKQS